MIRVRPFHTLLINYLSHRDVLTANFSRFGAGFILESHLREAKEELDNIRLLLQEVESRKDEKKPPVPFQINCAPCYKK